MHFLRRVYISVFGTVDAVVTRLQNHDALVAVSLKELEEKIRAAQMAYGTLTRTLAKIDEDATQALKDEELWTIRAKERGASGDKSAAIECLRRAHRAKATVEALQKQRETSTIAHRNLQTTISELQSSQKTLTLKHRELKARAEIQGATEFTSTISGGDVREMLGRWEDVLGTAVPTEPAVDQFEAAFAENETQTALEAELTELLK